MQQGIFGDLIAYLCNLIIQLRCRVILGDFYEKNVCFEVGNAVILH